MRYSSILTGVFLAVSISSSAFCDSDLSKHDREKVKPTIFKPVFHLSPSGKDAKTGNQEEFVKSETVDFPQFKPDTSPLRDREKDGHYPAYYHGQQRDLHPGGPQTLDFDTTNRLIQQQMYQQNMTNFQNSFK